MFHRVLKPILLGAIHADKPGIGFGMRGSQEAGEKNDRHRQDFPGSNSPKGAKNGVLPKHIRGIRRMDATPTVPSLANS